MGSMQCESRVETAGAAMRHAVDGGRWWKDRGDKLPDMELVGPLRCHFPAPGYLHRYLAPALLSPPLKHGTDPTRHPAVGKTGQPVTASRADCAGCSDNLDSPLRPARSATASLFHSISISPLNLLSASSLLVFMRAHLDWRPISSATLFVQLRRCRHLLPQQTNGDRRDHARVYVSRREYGIDGSCS